MGTWSQPSSAKKVVPLEEQHEETTKYRDYWQQDRERFERFHKGKLGDPVVEAEDVSAASLEESFLNNLDKSFNPLAPPPSKMEG